MSPALSFAAPALADALRVRQLTRAALGSDLAFANIYLLQKKYLTTIAFHGGFFFRHFAGNERLRGYAFPCGDGNLGDALELLREHAAAHAQPLRFCLLTEEQCRLLETHFPGQFTYKTDPGDADYLYRQADLAELPGTAYHAKRNHISKFEREHPHTRFALLSPHTVQDALAVAQGWLGSYEEASPALHHEARAIANALSHADELGLFGGVLYADSTPIAMTIGSYISVSVADIHYEKCLPSMRGAYPLINREMARQLRGCTLINREEDLNYPGLRQAKLSYHPNLVLHKYSALPAC